MSQRKALSTLRILAESVYLVRPSVLRQPVSLTSLVLSSSPAAGPGVVCKHGQHHHGAKSITLASASCGREWFLQSAGAAKSAWASISDSCRQHRRESSSAGYVTEGL